MVGVDRDVDHHLAGCRFPELDDHQEVMFVHLLGLQSAAVGGDAVDSRASRIIALDHHAKGCVAVAGVEREVACSVRFRDREVDAG